MLHLVLTNYLAKMNVRNTQFEGHENLPPFELNIACNYQNQLLSQKGWDWHFLACVLKVVQLSIETNALFSSFVDSHGLSCPSQRYTNGDMWALYCTQAFWRTLNLHTALSHGEKKNFSASIINIRAHGSTLKNAWTVLCLNGREKKHRAKCSTDLQPHGLIRRVK